MAKNDIFNEFGPNILVEFYESLRSGLAVYGEWDGAPGTFEATVRKVFEELRFPSEFIDEIKRMLHLAREVIARKASEVPISLDETFKLKTFCDAYFLVHAKKYIQVLASKRAKPPINQAEVPTEN